MTFLTDLEMTDEQARALVVLTGGDLVACLEFVTAQRAAIDAERVIQNVPPDEKPIELAQREFE